MSKIPCPRCRIPATQTAAIGWYKCTACGQKWDENETQDERAKRLQRERVLAWRGQK